jgi:site-specific recombinase XerD
MTDSRSEQQKRTITAPVRRKKSSSPLPDVFDDYLRYKRKHCQTPEKEIKGNHRVLGHFADYLEKHRINLKDLRIEEIDDFLADYLNGYSAATGRTYRAYLRGFLSYLFDNRRFLSRDLSPLVTGPPLFAKNKPPKFLRKEEVQKLFSGLAFSTPSELRTAALVHLGYMLGLRPCEICTITLDDIHFAKAELRLQSRKNDLPDVLPLPDAVIKAIAAYMIGGRPDSECRALFLTLLSPYRPLSASAAVSDIGRFMKANGLNSSAYWLRHTYAQNLLETGASIYAVKKMLGHDCIESTKKYLHIHVEMMRKVLFDECL